MNNIFLLLRAVILKVWNSISITITRALLEIEILRPHHKPTKLQTLGI